LHYISGKSIVRKFAGVKGGWKRVESVLINITTGGEFPSTWTILEASGISFCQKSFDGAGCIVLLSSPCSKLFHFRQRFHMAIQ